MAMKTLLIICAALLLSACLHIKAQIKTPASRASCPQGPHPSASLCWDYAGDPVDGYHVYRDTTSPPATLLTTVSGQSTLQYMDLAVTAGVTYYYHVKSFKGSQESSASNEVTCSIPFQPGTPQLQGKVN